MTQDNLDYYFERADEIIYSITEKAEKAEALLLLQRDIVHSQRDKNSNYFYLLGYIGYFTGNLSAANEAYFTKALAMDSDNEWAKYYYGFFLADSQRYVEALKVLDSIDFDYFQELDMTWRVLKGKELAVASALYISGKPDEEHLKEKVTDWLMEYLAVIHSDSDNYNYPGDIISALYDFIVRTPDALSLQTAVSILIRIMDRFGLASAYSTEYQFFASFAGEDKGEDCQLNP
jgi:hypothetical protein